MKKAKSSEPIAMEKRNRPAGLTPEARENQLINLAIDRAEQQLIDGTASSQVICHYLKLGSTVNRLEKEKLERENELLRAKVKSLEAAERSDEKYKAAIEAMKKYSGHAND